MRHPIETLLGAYGPEVLPVHTRAGTDTEGTWHLGEDLEDDVPLKRVKVGEVGPWCRECSWVLLGGETEERHDLEALGSVARMVETLEHTSNELGTKTFTALKNLTNDLEVLEDHPLPEGIASVVADTVKAARALHQHLRARLREPSAMEWLHTHVSTNLGGAPADFDDTPTLLALSPGRGTLARDGETILEALAVRDTPEVTVVVVPRVVADDSLKNANRRGYNWAQAVTLTKGDTPEVLEVAAHLYDPPTGAVEQPGHSLRRCLEVARQLSGAAPEGTPPGSGSSRAHSTLRA